MQILDWYLLRRFGLTLLYAILVFVLIVIFVDLVGNLGKFIDRDVPRLIILKYYLVYVPYIVVLALPIAMLLASLFSIGQLAKRNELTAIKAVGISLYRILAPLLVFSLLISLFALWFGETAVPAANQHKTAIENEYLESQSKRSESSISNVFWRDKKNRRIFISRFDAINQTAEMVSIQSFNGSQIVERVDAPQMRWQDSSWVLLNGYKRRFINQTEQAEAFEKFIDEDIDLEPGKLTQSQVKPEDMSFTELRIFTGEVKRNGGNPHRWLVDLYFKISIPFANFIMVLFGAPIASNKKRGSVIFGFIISLFVSFIYYGFNKFIQTLGQTGHLQPLFAAWLANLLFFAAGFGLLIYTRK